MNDENKKNENKNDASRRFSLTCTESLHERIIKYQEEERFTSKSDAAVKLIEIALDALEKKSDGLSIRAILATMHTEILFNQMIVKENNLMTRVLNIEELRELSKKDEIKFDDSANDKFASWKEQIAISVEKKFNGEVDPLSK